MNDFLKNIGSELKSQDNQITSDPIFMVQERKRIFGLDETYSENYVWVDCSNDYIEADKELCAKLDELDDGFCMPEEYKDYEKFYYTDVWINKMPFFTIKAAQKYIEKYGYRMEHPRVYVESGYRNNEWIEIRKLLMENAS